MFERLMQVAVTPMWFVSVWGHAYFRAWHEALAELR